MAVSPGAAIPCVPGGAPAPGTPTTPTTPAPTTPAPAADPSAAALATRTLERQAVDFVAASDYAHAAAVYELLQQQNPSNRVYAEAARILHNKADAGLPPL
jgi:TolA-binding protein